MYPQEIALVVVPSLVILLSAYVWLVLPFPFYRLELDDPARPRVTVTTSAADTRFRKTVRLFVSVIAALQLRQPSLALPESYLRRLSHYCREPMRPLISRKELGDYYVDLPKYFESLANTERKLLVFRSRLALVALPFRFVLDHLICKPLIYLSLLLYAIGIFSFFTLTKLIAWRHLRKIATELPPKTEYFRDCVEYLNGKQPPWEFGFLLFKVLEGYQFRKAIVEFGYEHPNCEFGIENAVISTNHLKGIDYIDVGCEAIKETPVQGEMQYKRIVHCYIEGNPFPNGAFRDIYLVHVVDHIPDLSRVFRELHRITVPGGKISFSGLSGQFSGNYLEKVVYEGNLFNNKNLEWYECLANEHGFEVLYQSYMQAGLAFRLWRFTAFFHYRTEAWSLFVKLYGSLEFVRALYRHVIDGLLLPLFLIDEYAVGNVKAGLNFMVVMRKLP